MRPVILITLAFAVLTRLAPVASATTADPWTMCDNAVNAVERSTRMPGMLLHAVSLVESGRWSAAQKATVAWPWTIYADGQGKFFPTKAAAIAAVQKLQARGIRVIDVGCMQINLYHHPNAFNSLESAFDPMTNATYAAKLLKTLRGAQGSWAYAVGQYHNSDWRARGQPYWRKVYATWNSEQRRLFEVRRAQRIHNNLARMAEMRMTDPPRYSNVYITVNR